ncbi:MAG TPA: hypothetical protein VF041_21330 [Gemmatimonadaceae bacterium]
MRTSWMVAVVGACLIAPGVASAQYTKPKPQPSPQAATDTGRTAKDTGRSARDTVSAAGGEVAPSANVPQAALSAQNDPKLIGSPAWWSTHATADGKPKQGRP